MDYTVAERGSGGLDFGRVQDAAVQKVDVRSLVVRWRGRMGWGAWRTWESKPSVSMMRSVPGGVIECV